VAHEINNPLASIKNCFHIVKGALPHGPGVESFLASMDNDVKRITAIIRKMYLLCQPRYMEAAPLKIDELLGEIVFAMQGPMSACGVILQDERDARDVETHLPSGELAQIFINLIRNALDAMPNGGRLRIQTSEEKEGVLVEISDTGLGIPSDVLPRIFEPFFTTKPPTTGEFSGMGLGLSVTRSLVEGMGGRIDVRTEMGAGTCFTTWYPLPTTQTPKQTKS